MERFVDVTHTTNCFRSSFVSQYLQNLPCKKIVQEFDKFNICTFFCTFQDHRDTQAGGKKLVKRSSLFLFFILDIVIFVFLFSTAASWLNIMFCDWIKEDQNQNKTKKDVKYQKYKMLFHNVHWQHLRRRFKNATRKRAFLTNLSILGNLLKRSIELTYHITFSV